MTYFEMLITFVAGLVVGWLIATFLTLVVSFLIFACLIYIIVLMVRSSRRCPFVPVFLYASFFVYGAAISVFAGMLYMQWGNIQPHWNSATSSISSLVIR